MSEDRTVHATLPDGGEIVRYDRPGKWWVEYPDVCRSITLAEAVRFARTVGAEVYLGRPGGRRFDAAILAAA